jgi:hypothetical protein
MTTSDALTNGQRMDKGWPTLDTTGQWVQLHSAKLTSSHVYLRGCKWSSLAQSHTQQIDTVVLVTGWSGWTSLQGQRAAMHKGCVKAS